MDFDRKLFESSGDIVTYQGKFVARFKHKHRSKSSFLSFLAKNFTVEEYFSALEQNAPLTVLHSKGYLQPHVKVLLRDVGYPETHEGLRAYIQDGVKKRASST